MFLFEIEDRCAERTSEYMNTRPLARIENEKKSRRVHFEILRVKWNACGRKKTCDTFWTR
jgi:hypothetical protein